MSEGRGPPRVRNKEAAPIQITSEQILREAYERREAPYKPSKVRISDHEELADFQSRKRREFEDRLRRNRLAMGNWMRYAAFELEYNEYARARSVFERALDVEPANPTLWNRYIESEMKTRNINHARNLLNRAVTLLPRMDTFWYKFAYMEETLGNIAGVRQIFERWMAWEPNEGAWMSYIRFERRCGEIERARKIFERYTIVHPEGQTWIRWARFEEENATPDDTRVVFNLAIETLGDEFMDERIFISYARFEANQKEFERARVIYKYALERMTRSKSQDLHRNYTIFEKQFGDKEGIEEVVMQKRRVHYQQLVRESPRNYDAWFDYLRLEESAGDMERTRDTYERAIAQVPPTHEKRHWRRYIYLWINYAVFEELDAKGIDRARQIYKEAEKLIPHKEFTFAKLWLLHAQFEIRQSQLNAARKLLGMALGMCPKAKLYKGYVELELQLREFERCRTLYEKFLEWNPANCSAWIKFADLESMLGDTERARAIFELAVDQEVLDMPELLWKAYIDFEYDEGEYDKTRALYNRLLQKTQHVKVWISFAQFEVNATEDEDAEGPSEESKERSREVFARALNDARDKDLKEERVLLLEATKEFERVHGTIEDVEKIEAQMPKAVKKRRELEDGSFEEYFDYLFPSDETSNAGTLKLLEAAQAWKAKMAAAEVEKAAEGSETSEDDE